MWFDWNERLNYTIIYSDKQLVMLGKINPLHHYVYVGILPRHYPYEIRI